MFAQAPVPGEVKTRLIPLLGAQAAADLYRQLLEHAVATAAVQSSARSSFVHPQLGSSRFRETVGNLWRFTPPTAGYDAVLGPAEDGSYVLIGVRQVCELLFAGIIWGVDAIARETRARLQALNWRWHELPPRWDMDLPEDVERLYRCRRRSEMHVEAVSVRHGR
jgi:glycosyltransferase A (GT-A) superfamily protein (DUF2064 family)